MIKTLFETLETHCRFHTLPVGIKLATKGETVPAKIKYPVDHLGNPLAVCQGMSLARSFGWCMAFKKEDHACPLPLVFLGTRIRINFSKVILPASIRKTRTV